MKRAVDNALHYAGLPISPISTIEITLDKFGLVVESATKLLMEQGVVPSRTAVHAELAKRGYIVRYKPPKRIPLAPITVTGWIDDALTEVLSQHDLPPGQRSDVVLDPRVYKMVIRETSDRLARRRLKPGQMMIADALAQRHYIAKPPTARPIVKVPATWRAFVPGKRRATVWSMRRGIRTGGGFRIYPQVVRGIS